MYQIMYPIAHFGSVMRIEVREETVTSIEAYARISTAFRVERQLVIPTVPWPESGGPLHDEPVVSPFTKDYDTIPDNRPTDWVRCVDTTRWRVFTAVVDNTRVGGAILAPADDQRAATRGVIELRDLRVAPTWRRRGIARTLWATIEAAAMAAGTLAIDIETQQINVAACRFYAAHGCVLVGVDRAAYPLLPDEVRLRWRKVVRVDERAT